MGRPYSNDLRERVVGTVIKGGLSCHQAAAQFGVGISTAINWVRRFRERPVARWSRCPTPSGHLSGHRNNPPNPSGWNGLPMASPVTAGGTRLAARAEGAT